MKKTLIILLTFITALITTLPFAANSASGAMKEQQSVVIETYDASDGMIPGIVRQIYQDRKGDLWIATSEGVSRYDGKQFKNFTTKDGLPGYDVRAIAEDDSGNLLFGTNNGVSRYDGKGFQNFTEDERLRNNYLILKGSDGQLWFNTDEGIICYDGEQFHSVGTQELVAPIQIMEDRNGNLWFGTWFNGVFRYDGKNFQQFTEQDGLIGNAVALILEDRMGNLWFGCWSGVTQGGVTQYDGKTFHNFRSGGDEGFPMTRMGVMLEDSSGNLWFSGFEGLCRYDGKQFKLYTVEDGLPINWTNTITEDLEGNLWIGTWGSGIIRLERNFQNLGTGKPIKDKDGNIWCSLVNGVVSKYDGQIFQPYLTQKDGVPKDALLQYIDSSGNLWLQSPKALWRYDGKQVLPYVTQKDGMPQNGTFLYIDSSGNLWFRDANCRNIWIYNGRSFQRIVTTTEPESDVSFQDSKGGVWIRTETGAYRYKDGTVSYITMENGLPMNYVKSIGEDTMGNIWLGMWRGGARSEGKNFQRFQAIDEFKNVGILEIFKDSADKFWFATFNGGVCRYDGKQFQWFTNQDGLASDLVQGIYEDSKGHFWFRGRDGGVTHFDGENFQRITTKDGLLSNSIGNILEDEKTGTMLFKTEHGIIRYSPPLKRVPPRISVERIIADKSYDNISEVQLPSTATHVTFEYYGKSFRTKQMRYNYILEGHESDWHKTWDESAEYENVKPGNYTFKVIAIDRDLIYSEEPATVKLKVVPPFYLRAGFLAPTVGFGTILIAMLTIVSIGYVKRRRQVQAYQREAVEELRDANRVQMSLMPESAPPIEGVEIAGKCIPANTVSGDFFDYLEGKNQDEIGLVVADVTGKAMKGAMNAVMTDGILRMAAEEMESLSPASLMAKINNVLKTRMEQYMNVTMVIAVIRQRNRVFSKNSVSEGENSVSEGIILTLANAAHHAHPILLRLGLSRNEVTYRNQGEVQTLKTGGLPLGMRAGIEYSEEQFLLESGDVVILMTDGIIEAEDSEGQLYSDSGRLEETVSQFTLDLPVEAMVDAILNDVMNFSRDKSQRDDDMTVVVAKIQ
ncbi:SpoIIE family protein phosphatase [bacterium]|nr:SpoIIE family protein phosphatase [bacterium]